MIGPVQNLWGGTLKLAAALAEEACRRVQRHRDWDQEIEEETQP
jgi:hypothetical protein